MNQNEEKKSLEKMLKPIGRRVSFKYPLNDGHTKEQINGVLKDREIMLSNPGSTDVPYWDVVDLIEFPGELESEWVRFGYYLDYPEPKGLVWGSQTTITEPIGTWKKLLVQTAINKPWFRKLLEEVMIEIKKHSN